ncbi:hypothetical protein SHKM778_01000 [Streptomyces sp. KM77-8]|uniref:Acyl-CoA dehydrogenase N-terminal bacteria domain-containing protein n=1 Tax=Streptomyces haneummycinicus TaxID=3074435 RepID=A0AAT9H8P6_9ACTN
MGHYKSNLRDIEFNLFEVLGRDKLYGSGPFEEMDVDTAKSILDELTRLAENELAESFTDADRNPPVFDPETGTAPVPASFKKSYQAFMDSEYWRLGVSESIGGTTAPLADLGVRRADPGRQPRRVDVLLGSRLRRRPVRRGQRHAEEDRPDRRRAAVGLHHGPHRAGRRLGRGRRPHQGRAAGGRLLAHRGREALHHVR